MSTDSLHPSSDTDHPFPSDGAPLTTHDFDGIRQYDRPPPTWWKWVFIATIAFSALYLPYRHLGAPGRSVVARYEQAQAENMRLQFAELGDLRPDEATLVRMMDDRRWLRVGESVYRTHCASCHGIDGGGIVGPNLTDDHYKNVRTIGDILRVVQHGAGAGAMPPWRDRLHLNEQILVSSYVASLRGTTPSSSRPPEGNVIPPWPEQIAEEEQPEATDPAAGGVQQQPMTPTAPAQADDGSQ